MCVYPEYITIATMRAQLLDHAHAPFLQEFGGHDGIYAWDVMKEPRLATAVTQPKSFFSWKKSRH